MVSIPFGNADSAADADDDNLSAQRGERVEIVRTGETNEPQRIRALLCGVCVQCGAHGAPVATKGGPGRRQSCDLGK